jgi:hypothetical protein
MSRTLWVGSLSAVNDDLTTTTGTRPGNDLGADYVDGEV